MRVFDRIFVNSLPKLRPSTLQSVLMPFASPESRRLFKGPNAKVRTIQYLVFRGIGAKSNRGIGGWVWGYSSGSRFQGVGRWEEIRVGSGVLKVLGAFWDKLEGGCRPPQT